MDLVEHEVLPEEAEILVPELVPPPVVAHEAGVEAVGLRGRDYARERQRYVLPARRTPASQTTERRRQAVSKRRCQNSL